MEDDKVKIFPGAEKMKLSNNDPWKALVGLFAVIVILMLTVIPWAIGIAAMATSLLGVDI